MAIINEDSIIKFCETSIVIQYAADRMLVYSKIGSLLHFKKFIISVMIIN
jgi:hypothetical protein